MSKESLIDEASEPASSDLGEERARPGESTVEFAAPENDAAAELTMRLMAVPFDLAGEMALGAARVITAAAGASLRVGRSMLRPERLELMAETGRYLRDMREVAGLTLMELSEALDLEDKTLLEAVENGTATLSFELILRLAALVARHDPLPFVMRMTRTYNPGVWRILEDWGVGRMTLQFEREREFVNILRPHDGARKLSDDGFAKVLEVTKSAFELALFYALAEEGIQDRIGPTGEASPTGDD
ncbi:MAG: multiprotein-bridging factor 1 family protein [Candidatus Promineifilaceae bacterium]|jgi:transcriptional regulator with XRE-family HTH domain